MWVNLMKQSRKFGPAAAPMGQNASVDGQGWPTEDFAAVPISFTGSLASGQWPPVNISGTYYIQASGNASMYLGSPDTVGTILSQSYDATTNLFTAFVQLEDSAQEMVLIFNNTQRQPGGPAGMVNLTVLQPGYNMSRADDFADAFIQHLSRFDIVRGLGWTLRAPDNETNWSDRSVPSNPSYLLSAYGEYGPGVPWEVLMALANRISADVWVNVPVQCTNDYVTQLAKLINTTLDPSLAAYIEFSNEVWNCHFTGCQFNAQAAAASVAEGDPDMLASVPTVTNVSSIWAQRRYGLRIKQISDLFASVLGAENVGRGRRIRPILAGQGDDGGVADTALLYLTARFGAPSQYLAALSIAPYFGLPSSYNNATLTSDEVIGILNASLYNMSVDFGIAGDNQLAAHAALAAYYSLELRGYEGGPATTGPNIPEQLWAKANASVDPRMAGLVSRGHQIWQQWGGVSANHHQAGATGTYAPWGAFGLLTDMRNLTSPKTQGLDMVKSAPPATLTAGCPVPTLGYNASKYVGYYGNPSSPIVTYLPANTTLKYLVRNPTGASSSIQLNVTIWLSSVSSPPALLEVSTGVLPGQAATVIQVPNTGSVKTFQPVSVVFPYDVAAGQLATVQLRVITAFGYRLMALDFTAAS